MDEQTTLADWSTVGASTGSGGATGSNRRRRSKGKRRISKAERAAGDRAALERAQSSQSAANDAIVIEAFASRGGISAGDVEPRVNVLTYRAWRAKGRQVRRGEKGVKVTTWVERSVEETDPRTGRTETKVSRYPRAATVFHISQTDSIAVDT